MSHVTDMNKIIGLMWMSHVTDMNKGVASLRHERVMFPGSDVQQLWNGKLWFSLYLVVHVPMGNLVRIEFVLGNLSVLVKPHLKHDQRMNMYPQKSPMKSAKEPYGTYEYVSTIPMMGRSWSSHHRDSGDIFICTIGLFCGFHRALLRIHIHTLIMFQMRFHKHTQIPQYKFNSDQISHWNVYHEIQGKSEFPVS